MNRWGVPLADRASDRLNDAMTTTHRSHDDVADGDPDAAVSALDDAECHRLLGTRQIGRLYLGTGDAPSVFPTDYVLDGRTLQVRSTTRITLAAVHRADVTFAVDDLDPRTGAGWTVLVRGRAERSTGDPRPVGQRAHILPAPRVPDDDAHWLRLTPQTIEGWRTSARPGTEWSWGIGALM